MKLRPESFAMTLLLALLTSVGPLSTDMYLPSLPTITEDLNTTTAGTQLTLSVFLIGFAFGQILYGPISDRYGRRPVLLAGLSLFFAGTLACYLAPTIEALIAGRFLQAFAASAATVVARAVVRDLYSAERAGRMLSHMGALMAGVPAVAPAIGGVVHVLFGWRATFAVVALFAAALIAAIAWLLPETLKEENRRRRGVGEMAGAYRMLLGHGEFRRYVVVASCSFGGLFAWISGSSFVLQGVYGVTEQAFGFYFALAVFGYIAGTLVGARLTTRIGIDRTIMRGAVLLFAGGLSMLILTRLETASLWHVLVPIVVYMAGVGLTLPQSMAGALSPFPERAGAASSLLGFLQMGFGALVGIGVGQWIDKTPTPLAIAVAISGLSAFAMVFSARRGTA